ncbi:hypothetical protein FKW77_003050 [Venturia effusa]|uniref:Uncharacterized protein n=1 Tax=Venturia effusa TaxID=50376 RepID=A0A517LGV3_9PEZI|nr:hypothetical protein FKW77_003050 [Venturia effusa]
MSWCLKTLKAAGAVIAGAGGFWIGLPTSPHSNSTNPVVPDALSAITPAFPVTLSSSFTSAPIIGISSSTASANINGSYISDWSSSTNASDIVTSSLSTSSPISSTVLSSTNAFYYFINSTTRDESPLLFALNDASRSMGTHINEFVGIVRALSSFIAQNWLSILGHFVKGDIVDNPSGASEICAFILAMFPNGVRLSRFIGAWIDYISWSIWLAVALVSGTIAAPCIMIYVACQAKFQALRMQTFRDCFELGLLISNRLYSCTTKPAFLSLLGTEIIIFIYLIYAMASDSPDLWRCVQIVVGHYIYKALSQQSELPRSWRAFAHAFCSKHCVDKIAQQAAIITRQEARNARVVAKYKEDIAVFFRIRWSVDHKSGQEESRDSNPPSSSSSSEHDCPTDAAPTPQETNTSSEFSAEEFEREVSKRVDTEKIRMRRDRAATDYFLKQLDKSNDWRQQRYIKELQDQVKVAKQMIKVLLDSRPVDQQPITASIVASNLLPSGEDADVYEQSPSRCSPSVNDSDRRGTPKSEIGEAAEPFVPISQVVPEENASADTGAHTEANFEAVAVSASNVAELDGVTGEEQSYVPDTGRQGDSTMDKLAEPSLSHEDAGLDKALRTDPDVASVEEPNNVGLEQPVVSKTVRFALAAAEEPSESSHSGHSSVTEPETISAVATDLPTPSPQIAPPSFIFGSSNAVFAFGIDVPTSLPAATTSVIAPIAGTGDVVNTVEELMNEADGVIEQSETPAEVTVGTYDREAPHNEEAMEDEPFFVQQEDLIALDDRMDDDFMLDLQIDPQLLHGPVSGSANELWDPLAMDHDDHDHISSETFFDMSLLDESNVQETLQTPFEVEVMSSPRSSFSSTGFGECHSGAGWNNTEEQTEDQTFGADVESNSSDGESWYPSGPGSEASDYNGDDVNSPMISALPIQSPASPSNSIDREGPAGDILTENGAIRSSEQEPAALTLDNNLPSWSHGQDEGHNSEDSSSENQHEPAGTLPPAINISQRKIAPLRRRHRASRPSTTLPQIPNEEGDFDFTAAESLNHQNWLVEDLSQQQFFETAPQLIPNDGTAVTTPSTGFMVESAAQEPSTDQGTGLSYFSTPSEYYGDIQGQQTVAEGNRNTDPIGNDDLYPGWSADIAQQAQNDYERVQVSEMTRIANDAESFLQWCNDLAGSDDSSETSSDEDEGRG